MFLVDSHCHLDRLDLASYDGDLDRALQAARDNGVGHFLCVSIGMDNFPEVLRIAREHDDVSASVGVHPNEHEGKDPDVETLVKLAADPEVVAIGETGLDYFRSEGDLEWQRDRFRRHIAAAKRTGKPLIIHMREATEDTLRILREEGADEVGGVMHCFVEDWDTAKAAMDLDFHISFSGIVTFNSARALQEVARKLPAERMLVETDSPYLAPVPNRGKPNQPAWVRHVAEFIAELRNAPLEQVAEVTTENYFRLFGGRPALRNVAG
ncbi:MAG TPA: TatD family deoxyribonuclease [Gammaproteobacteria bacterium]|nr:TatD family deoxyribonuclease [Gammaproteobacteria bacterium]